MTVSPVRRIGLEGPGRELVSLVGAGGKSMLLRALGDELAARRRRVVLTTTTRLAADQATPPLVATADPRVVDAALGGPEPLTVVVGRIPGKVTGPTPHEVDLLFAETRADAIVVEADGARSLPFKAPAAHEPAIPSRSTTVIVVCAADALGKPVDRVSHRPERVAVLAGISLDDPLTVEAASTVLLHRDGGLKRIPSTARVVMVVNRVSDGNERAARELGDRLGAHRRVERVVLLPRR